MRTSALIYQLLRCESPLFAAAALVFAPQAETQQRPGKAEGATLQVVALGGAGLVGDVLQLELGQSAELELRAVDGGGSTVDLSSADIQWRTSNPDLIRIKAGGSQAVVAGLGNGEAILSAGALGQTITLRAAVGKFSRRAVPTGSSPKSSAPPPPTGLVASATTLSVRLSWAPAAGATGYQVFRSKSTSGPWVGITLQPTADTSYTDQPVLPNTTFVYQVASVLSQPTDAPARRAAGVPVNVTRRGSVAIMTGMSMSAGTTVSVTTPNSLATVGRVGASAAGGQVLLRWNAVEGAHHYLVQESRRMACPATAYYNTEGLSQLVSLNRWGASCQGMFSVNPVYRLARFPTERDTTDWVGPGAGIQY